jgi:hypothetical protein
VNCPGKVCAVIASIVAFNPTETNLADRMP